MMMSTYKNTPNTPKEQENIMQTNFNQYLDNLAQELRPDFPDRMELIYEIVYLLMVTDDPVIPHMNYNQAFKLASDTVDKLIDTEQKQETK